MQKELDGEIVKSVTHLHEGISQSLSSMVTSAVSGLSTTAGSAEVRTTLNNTDSVTTTLSTMGMDLYSNE